jgi:hypothetical protein
MHRALDRAAEASDLINRGRFYSWHNRLNDYDNVHQSSRPGDVWAIAVYDASIAVGSAVIYKEPPQILFGRRVSGEYRAGSTGLGHILHDDEEGLRTIFPALAALADLDY